MQQGRAVAVEHALGIARRARGVAERGRGALVEDRPRVVLALAREQGLVAEDVGERGRGHVRFVGHHHDLLDRGELVRDPLHQLDEGEVHEQHPVLGVVDDVDDLLGEEAGVHRVQHGAHAGDAVEELLVAVAVPGQRADPVAVFDAEPGHEVGDAPRAPLAFGIAVAVDRAFDGARDHLAVAVILRRVANQRRDHQRDLLHQAVHGSSPRSVGRGRAPRAIIGRRRDGRKTFPCVADILAALAGSGMRSGCATRDRGGEDRETGGKDGAGHRRFLGHRRGDRNQVRGRGRACRGGGLLRSGQGAAGGGEDRGGGRRRPRPSSPTCATWMRSGRWSAP